MDFQLVQSGQYGSYKKEKSISGTYHTVFKPIPNYYSETSCLPLCSSAVVGRLAANTTNHVSHSLNTKTENHFIVQNRREEKRQRTEEKRQRTELSEKLSE
jgi:hypothetical protein